MLDEYETELIREILSETEKLIGKPDKRKPCPVDKLQPLYDSVCRIDAIGRTILDLPNRKNNANREPLVF